MIKKTIKIKHFWINFTFILLFLLSPSFGQTDKLPPLIGEALEFTAEQNTNLFTIARKYGVAIDHIMMANDITSTAIKKGKTIIIPTLWIPPVELQDGLVLNLPERAIYLYKDSKVVKVYPVAIGAIGRWQTPTGNYKIIVKTKNPVWLPPEWAGIDQPVLPGPDNPLGDRWMGLSRPGYGIHATNAPNSIGLATSHGCIRMYPESAHDLFEQIEVGAPVKIIYEPIKFGFSYSTGKFYLSVFPDIYYYGTNNLPNLWDKINRLELEKLVEEKRVIEILKQKKGIPQVLIGSDIKIKLNDDTVYLPLAPIIKDGEILVCSELFKNLGFDVEFDKEKKIIQLNYGYNKLTMGLDNRLAYFNDKGIQFETTPSKLREFIVIPISVLNEFGYKIKWDKGENLVTIEAE